MGEAANPAPTPPGGPQRGAPPPAPGWRRLLLPIALLLGVAAWQFFGAKSQAAPPISYTSFYGLVDSGKVESVVIRGPAVSGKLKSKESVEGRELQSFETVLPPIEDRELLPLLRKQEVHVEARSEEPSGLVRVLVSLLPWAVIIGVWLWISRRAQRAFAGGPGAILGQRSHRFEPSKASVTFEDVAGLKSAKSDLLEIVDFLKQPERFRRLGGKVPRGVLLVGPPGTGKTLLARAVAGEADVPFFSISGSEFIELFVGMGASRVRELFAEARKVSPAILFIDEIDAVGRSRGTGLGGGHDEREQTLNQLLSEMDGFSRNDLTIVLAATNRPDVLDPALLRPGRFDRRVIVDRPERPARKAILLVHTRGKPIAPDVDLDVVAGRTPGFSGADLANLVNEAALGATRRGADAIASVDFLAAYDKIVLGDPRETKLDPDEKRRVAVHESGHALLAHFTPHAEALDRVSIIPRGMSLGVTQQTPAIIDRHIVTRSELVARLRVLMGGYAAEHVVLGDTSSGAEHDLRKATEIATAMVAHYGMSDRVGPTFHEHRVEHAFLGQRLATEGGTSDATVRVIEEETRRILDLALSDAKATVEKRRATLDRLVAAVLEQESLDREALERLLGEPAGGEASAGEAGSGS